MTKKTLQEMTETELEKVRIELDAQVQELRQAMRTVQKELDTRRKDNRKMPRRTKGR